jgi:uncharacterized protein (TIGR02145 family)
VEKQAIAFTPLRFLILGIILLKLLTACRSSDTVIYPYPPAEVSDWNGNSYKTVIIGSQAWLSENLRSTSYRNGDPVSFADSDSAWKHTTEGAWCRYEGQNANEFRYGLLYNGMVINDSRQICPDGWHIPSEKEWYSLTTSLGGEHNAGIHLKEQGTSHWAPPNEGSDDASRFNALPAGYRNDEGTYGNRHFSTIFWSSDAVDPNHQWYHYLYYNYQGMYKDYFHDIRHGFSIRCIWDLPVGPEGD